MTAVVYQVEVGALRASNRDSGNDIPLRALLCERSSHGTAGRLAIDVGGPGQVPTRPGDPVRAVIDAGDGEHTVFQGTVDSVRQSVATTRINAADALSDLARTRVCRSYEAVTPGFVARDLIEHASARPGTIDEGPELGSWVLHPDRRALAHLRSLAALSGADVFCRGDGAVCFETARQGEPSFRFAYGTHVLSLDLCVEPPVVDSVEVWGEGAAGTRGLARAHWLVSELQDVRGRTGFGPTGELLFGVPGKRPATTRSGAVRTQDAAERLAAAQAGMRASRVVRGHLEILGRPDVELGDLVVIDDLPPARWAAVQPWLDARPLRVRGLTHRVDVTRGFITRMEF